MPKKQKMAQPPPLIEQIPLPPTPERQQNLPTVQVPNPPQVPDDQLQQPAEPEPMDTTAPLELLSPLDLVADAELQQQPPQYEDLTDDELAGDDVTVTSEQERVLLDGNEEEEHEENRSDSQAGVGEKMPGGEEVKEKAFESCEMEEDGEIDDDKTVAGEEKKSERSFESGEYTNDDVQEEDNMADYIVCQATQLTSVIACAAKKNQPQGWPRFVLVNDSVVEHSTRRLQLGDRFELLEFEENGQPNQNWLAPAGQINAQAKAKKILLYPQALTKLEIGIIVEVERHRPPERRLKYLAVAAPSLPCSQRLYTRQCGMEEVRAGMVVELGVVELQRPATFKLGQKGGYILPGNCSIEPDMYCPVHQPTLAISVSTAQFVPFRPGLDLDQLRRHEDILAAAVAACTDNEIDEADQHGVTVSPTILNENGRFVEFCFEHFLSSKRKLVKMGDIWEEDSQVTVRLTGEGTKICAAGYVMESNRAVLGGEFVLQARVRVVQQEAKNYDAEADFEALKGGAEADIRPCVSVKALERRMNCLLGHDATSAVKGGPTGDIYGTLLGRGDRRPAPALEWKALAARHPAIRQLQGGQQQSAMLMLDSIPRVLVQQAPPGTGKTYTAACIAAAALARDPSVRVLCLAPLNVAVVKLCRELATAVQTEGSAPIPEILALFSGNGKARYSQQLEAVADHLLPEAVSGEAFMEQLTESEQRKVERYQRYVTSRPKLADETVVARIFLDPEKTTRWSAKRVLCATLGLAELIVDSLPPFDMVVIDEAGQIPFVQLIAVLAQLRQVKKVCLTGDRLQLGVNMQSIPGAVSRFGLNSALEWLIGPAIDRTTLTVSFRSHSSIVRAVAEATYRPEGEILLPGPGAHSLLIGSPLIKLPVENVPILLLHVPSSMEGEVTSYSSTNPGQTAAALSLLTALEQFPGTVRTISLYAAQAQDMGRALQERGLTNIVSATADSMQGHEADICVLLTTVSSDDSARRSENAFWNDSRRINVAISRAREGLVAALRDTVICSATKYLRTMAHPDAHYARGVLHQNEWTVQDYSFFALTNYGEELGDGAAAFVSPPPRADDAEQWPPLPPVPGPIGPLRGGVNRPDRARGQRGAPYPLNAAARGAARGGGNQQQQQQRRPDVCYRCGQPGHFSRYCQNR